MSLKVIELNDHGIKVGDENGLILRSPGFALAVDDRLEVGEAAELQARLRPTHSFNKYWQELNLEPISHGQKIRHHADLAYAQLLDLAESAGIDGDVIFAVPGSFNRQQLAILLGLARQSPFSAIGVVDTALAAATAMAHAGHTVFADIQLHQVVLTRLALAGDELVTESVVQIPGVGSQNFMNLMMRIATGMFIQQCRFNPQHNAESEQQLYNELPAWLLRDNSEKTLQLELRSGDAVHTAKLPRETLIGHLNDYYKKIHEQIDAITPDPGTRLLLSHALAALPGFQAGRAVQAHIVGENAINTACHQYRALIERYSKGESSGEGMHLADRFPVAALDLQHGAADEPAPGTDHPTHALHDNRAVAVNRIDIRNNVSLNGGSGQAIVMQIENLPRQLGRIEKRGGRVYLDSGKQEVFLNGQPVSGEQLLGLGDRIRFVRDGAEISLIQVKDGE